MNRLQRQQCMQSTSVLLARCPQLPSSSQDYANDLSSIDLLLSVLGDGCVCVCLSVAPTTSLIAKDFSPSGISSSSSNNHQSPKLLLKPSSQTAATVAGKPQFTTTHLAAVAAAAVKKYKLHYCAKDT